MADVVNTRETLGNHETLSSLVAATLSELIDDQIYDLRPYAFYQDTGLEAVTLQNIRQAGQYAFANCSRLATVNLGYLHILRSNLFQNCSMLDTVYAAETESAESGVFSGCTNLVTIYMPELLSLSSSMFRNCTKLADVYVPKLKSGNSYAFYGFSSLEDIDLHNLTSVSAYMFDGCTKLRNVTLSNDCSSLGNYAFYDCNSLTELSFPSVRSVGSHCFYSCDALRSITLPKATSLSQYSFAACKALETITIPSVTSVGSYAFYDTPIQKITFPKLTSTGQYMFYYNGPHEADFEAKVTLGSYCMSLAYNMTSIILRSEKMCTMSGATAFDRSPFANGYGWIYVPDNLVDTYKSATNWSTYADMIVPISEYPKAVTGTITDSWDDIIVAEMNGTYKYRYSINDTKVVKIGDTYYAFRIIGFDKDDKADGTGKAPITWMSVGTWNATNMINNTHSTSIRYNWGDSFVRSYMRNTIFPMIDEELSPYILEVTKQSRTLTNLTVGTATTTDTLFVPSLHELGIENSMESGAVYSDVFTGVESRRLRSFNFGHGDNVNWWTRSAGSGSQYSFSAIYGVHNVTVDNVTTTDQGGQSFYAVVSNSFYYPICFCT